MSAETGYVPDAEIGIEILKRKEPKFREAVELLRGGDACRAVSLLRSLGLCGDSLVFFAASVLGVSVSEGESLVVSCSRESILETRVAHRFRRARRNGNEPGLAGRRRPRRRRP